MQYHQHRSRTFLCTICRCYGYCTRIKSKASGRNRNKLKKENICGPSGELVKIEIFAHGALCMAISGKCYLSLDNFGYSANRGACLQACRRLYNVKDADNELELLINEKYILSQKIYVPSVLDKILDAGVSILKIEGRGRSPEYVKTVTRCYREAVDAYFDGTYGEEKVKRWTEELRSVYNRDFWDGYYLGRKLGNGSIAMVRKLLKQKYM